MILLKYTDNIDFEYDIQGVVRSFFPGEEMVTNKQVEARITIVASFCDYSNIEAELLDNNANQIDYKMKITIYYDNNKFISREFSCAKELIKYDLVRKETKNRLKRVLYQILREITGKDLPWGTLSGIRPTKISSHLLEEGLSPNETEKVLKEEYYVSDLRAKESTAISQYELQLLSKIDYKNGYSLYIGIPFCPSTCLYCSFTSNPLSRFKDKIDNYLDALIKELTYVSKAFKHKHLDTIYIGGGTPTTLLPEQLDRLLLKVEQLFNTEDLWEYTVEAGRPDSITREKLKVIKKYKVSRISINPQTMKNETLKIIGRHHTVEEFLESYMMAREEGFDNINMDFILGLPNETREDVVNSMDKVIELNPDSLTIHSLAIKRASRLNIFKEDYSNYYFNNSEEIMEITREAANKLNMKPYYLYRQKNMTGNLENIGYAKAGKAGIYNILIMEEKQTIVAVGAGSSTKMVFPGGEKIERIENVKDVDLYIERIDEMIGRKEAFIENNKVFGG